MKKTLGIIMIKLKNLFEKTPELKEQYILFENTILKEEYLDKTYIKWVAYAAAIALKDQTLLTLVEEKVGKLEDDEKKAVFLATSRMAVTNPYFMARNVHSLNAGGSLESLNMSIIQNLGVTNSIAYHYACITVSSINSGFVCFNSHISSLKASNESDASIDQALRLCASLHSLKQLLFNASIS